MGEVDVQDCLDAAMYLADEGRVDAKRLIIRGSSAGGYVTLCALTFHELFAAGGIYYGIADLEALVSYTHKFEAHYLDTLIGPYPEEKKTYKERSPIHFTDMLNCPMILMQGLKDKIVPPEQSQRMAEALDLKSIPCVYLTFEHEGHGFDRSETIKLCLEAEHYFYARILDIPQKGEPPPIHIQNLDEV
jgi:dipeptidyl aminopeptidase/acylaminoacyl peptidase